MHVSWIVFSSLLFKKRSYNGMIGVWNGIDRINEFNLIKLELMFYEFIWKYHVVSIIPCKGLVLFNKMYVINNISLKLFCLHIWSSCLYLYRRISKTRKKTILTPIFYFDRSDNDQRVIDMFTECKRKRFRDKSVLSLVYYLTTSYNCWFW